MEGRLDAGFVADGEARRKALGVQAAILDRALPKGITVSFGEGRRRTDVAMALFKGDRDAVLALPSELEESLDLDMHFMHSTHGKSHFELLVVFMQPLDEQQFRSPERRASLRARFAELAGDPESAELLDRDLRHDGADVEATGPD